MASGQQTAISVMLVILVLVNTCTSSTCDSYTQLAAMIDYETEQLRNETKDEVLDVFMHSTQTSWHSNLTDVLNRFCRQLDEEYTILEAEFNRCTSLRAPIKLYSEICDDTEISYFMEYDINNTLSEWNLTEECHNVTLSLRRTCTTDKTESSHTEARSPYKVARLMYERIICMFDGNSDVTISCGGMTEKWKTYVLVWEFLDSLHPRVRYSQP